MDLAPTDVQAPRVGKSIAALGVRDLRTPAALVGVAVVGKSIAALGVRDLRNADDKPA